MHAHNDPSNSNNSTHSKSNQFREYAYLLYIRESNSKWNSVIWAGFVATIGAKYCLNAGLYNWNSVRYCMHKIPAKNVIADMNKKHGALMMVSSLLAGGFAFFTTKKHLDKTKSADQAQSEVYRSLKKV